MMMDFSNFLHFGQISSAISSPVIPANSNQWQDRIASLTNVHQSELLLSTSSKQYRPITTFDTIPRPFLANQILPRPPASANYKRRAATSRPIDWREEGDPSTINCHCRHWSPISFLRHVARWISGPLVHLFPPPRFPCATGSSF